MHYNNSVSGHYTTSTHRTFRKATIHTYAVCIVSVVQILLNNANFGVNMLFHILMLRNYAYTHVITMLILYITITSHFLRKNNNGVQELDVSHNNLQASLFILFVNCSTIGSF